MIIIPDFFVWSRSVRHDENFRHRASLDAVILLNKELVAGSDVFVADVVLVLVDELLCLDHTLQRNLLFINLLGKSVVFHHGRYLDKVVFDAQPPAHGIVILECYK